MRKTNSHNDVWKHDKSNTKPYIFTEVVHRETQIKFTIINRGKHKIEQIYVWNPKTTWLIM